MPNVDEKLTFGIELEGVRASSESQVLAQMWNFTKRYDHSITDDHGQPLPRTLEEGGGFEYITPVLSVDVRMTNAGERLAINWGTSLNAIRDLCLCVAHVNKSCGVHIHLGRPASDSVTHSKWEPERVRTMLTVGMLLEPKIFDVVPESRRGNHHSNFIRSRYSSDDICQFYPTGNVVARKFDNPKRYCWMNLIETRRVGNDTRPGRGSSTALGTIEIRALGNTASYDYISAWTVLWMKIAAFVAYLPSSLAMMRCVFSEELASDFATLAKLKSTVDESVVLPAEPPSPALPQLTPQPAPPRPHRPLRRPLNVLAEREARRERAPREARQAGIPSHDAILRGAERLAEPQTPQIPAENDGPVEENRD